jgi:hypothetical protein
MDSLAAVKAVKCVDVKLASQICDSGLTGADPLTAAFRDDAVAQVVIAGPATHAVSGLEHDEGLATGAAQVSRRGQAGQSTPDDRYVQYVIASVL